MPSIPPSNTIYIKNINEKVKKPELRRQLYSLLTPYGKLLDVVATRRDAMRGQAFAVFDTIQAATSALRGLDGFAFYDQPLRMEYAKTKSKATLRKELGVEGVLEQELEKANKASTRVTISHAGIKRRQHDDDAEEDTEKRRKVVQEEQDDDDDGEEMEMADDDDDKEMTKKTSQDNSKPVAAIGSTAHQILYAPDLPNEVTEDMLAVLFQQYPGFQKVQLHSTYAFIYYESAQQATTAKQGLDQFRLSPAQSLSVHYAKRS